MKRGIRILGIDDSPFEKYGKGKKVLVIGVVYRDGIVEGVISAHMTKDGADSTSKLYGMVSGSRFLQQIKLILIHGTMLAGLNVTDISLLSRKLNIPVIAVTRKKPEMGSVYSALRKSNARTSGSKIRMLKRIIDETGEFHKIDVNDETYYVQSAGIDGKDAESLLRKFGLAPLRLAHIIGSGVVNGESSGRI